MGGVGMGGVGMGGWRIFNSSLTFTVLLGFVMAVPAQAQDCIIPMQPGSRDGPTMCKLDRESDGTIVVTLTYADELTVGYNRGDDPAVLDPDTPGGYKPGAYTCLHYYKDSDKNGEADLEDKNGEADLEGGKPVRVREVGHNPGSESVVNESVNGEKKGHLIFEYPPEVGCEEEEQWVLKFEMFNGNPYVETYDTRQEGFFTVSHLGYNSDGRSDYAYQLDLGTLPCFNEGAGNSPATGAPIINGTPQVNEPLTADTSDIRDANGLTNVNYAYQWLRVDGGTETLISGATGKTYIGQIRRYGQAVKGAGELHRRRRPSRESDQ